MAVGDDGGPLNGDGRAESERDARSAVPGGGRSRRPPFEGAAFDRSPFDEHGRDRLRADVEQLRAEVDRHRDRFRRKSDEINQRSGRNLGFAIALGVALGVALIASLLFVKQLFIIFGVAMVALLVIELANAMRASGRDVPRVPSAAVAVVVVPVAYYFGPAGQWIALLAGIVIVTAWRLVEASFANPRPRRSEVWRDFLAGAFIQIYVTFLASFTVMLVAQERGEFWVLGIIIIVIAIDTGAYVVGLNFGKHKLAPRISPGKTWEGLAGAFLTAVIVSIPVSIFLLQQPWWLALVIAPILVVTATAGDLTESMFKRDLGIKDMSTWLPGHGGFFDRLDSILPSGAIAFALYFWTADWGGPLLILGS
ncbi:phosphatidate cytidylyltransferase [Pseudoclavibacter endophyticus]|uniref:Phosphatidate cytidylyltransferase n=1 Tax=Pseudoclavibacter endophyticus TaxID=1778590 RepID=A0A6H9WBF0_9MICO|nr:phosphatidate cytidylyltransferase [Pseudoclavibacter endophyticus]KAB1647900.1 phosphatidate cytidylyltransferase [Pseudoclavibacter endophyticus]GGA73740.1 phosphatidate cytidylyltransferase [Pseudoclavibacter endophyticus]